MIIYGFVQFLFGNNHNIRKGLYTKVKDGPCFMDYVFYFPQFISFMNV
jgi:hypothetical protein